MGRRTVLVLAAVIFAALVATWRITARHEPPGGGEPAAAPPERAPAPIAGDGVGAPRAGPVVQPAGPPAPRDPATPGRPRTPLDDPAWKDAKVAFGLRQLGRLAPYVKVGLDEARQDMAFCFARESAALAEQRASDPPALTLYLETRGGGLDVVDVTVEHRGGARAELLDCCREVLRGHAISAFDAAPGQRYLLKYSLD
jgi:hypothetical protein